MELEKIKPGARLLGRGSRRIGTVDAVFADYLLVRTAGLLPIDLYVPRADVTIGPLGPHVDAGRGRGVPALAPAAEASAP